jgi:hypothetical protein
VKAGRAVASREGGSAPQLSGITPEEREMWRKQNIADLLYWADLPLAKKIELVEGMEEVARSIHGGKLPR